MSHDKNKTDKNSPTFNHRFSDVSFLRKEKKRAQLKIQQRKIHKKKLQSQKITTNKSALRPNEKQTELI